MIAFFRKKEYYINRIIILIFLLGYICKVLSPKGG